MISNEMEVHSIGPRPKPGRGSPAGLACVVFLVATVLAYWLIGANASGMSNSAVFAAGVIAGLVCGAVTDGLARRSQDRRRAREAQEAYEMQQNRAAEAAKQIAEMKRKAAKAEGSE